MDSYQEVKQSEDKLQNTEPDLSAGRETKYKDLLEAKSDKDFILETLDEGVFFLNSELELESAFSASFENIIDQIRS